MAGLTIIFSALLVVLVLLSTAPVMAQTSEKQKYVIFRDDDIGLGHQTDTLKAVNQVHADENVPVTLGVVPHPDGPWPHQLVFDVVQPSQIVRINASNQLYRNHTFYDYMRLISSNPLFEFAQHGYTHLSDGLATSSHNISEFSGEPYSVQYPMIRAGRDDIKAAFGRLPTTFIPPWDRGDVNTLEALRALGFTEYCSGDTDMQMLQGRVSGIRIEPAFDIYGSNYAALNQSFKSAKNRIDQFFSDPHNDTIVVAYHFWQFSGPGSSVDIKKVQLLRDFITYVKTRGCASFTTLDRSTTVQSEVPPAIAENVASSTSSEAVVHDLSILSGLTNLAAEGIPLYALIIPTVGVVLVGLYLYMRRGRDVDARSVAAPSTPVEQHTSAWDNGDATPVQPFGWNQEVFRKYGVVVPSKELSQPSMPSEQQGMRESGSGPNE